MTKAFWLRSGTALAMGLVVAGCSAVSGRDGRYEDAAALAKERNMTPAVIKTSGGFSLVAFSRNTVAGSPVTLYIEGDGLAWLDRDRPSSDPTPRNPLGLRLAMRDNAANVIALERPCQYVASPQCGAGSKAKYWTSHRFAPEVVDALSEAISKLIQPGQDIHLVGYSGGGALAALIAAKRTDVKSLRTVAGNLDTAAWTTLHRVSPLTGSLNPRDVAAKIATIPQIHYVGRQDEVVPAAVAESYLAALRTGATLSPSCASLVQVQASHSDGWEAYWPKAALTKPVCR